MKVKNSPQTTDANGEAVFEYKFGLRSKNGKIVFEAEGLNATIIQK